MTGGEIVPVAAGKAAQKALSGDGADKKLLTDLAKDHPAAKKAADSYARRLAIREGLLLKLYSPLSKLAGISKEYYENDFAGDMADKIKDIPEEYLTSPKPSVAVPAMQALGYSLDEPDLKEMYLNLLATATDARTADNAHPSFAEIIKQLSAHEAGVLRKVLQGELTAIVSIHHTLPGAAGYNILKSNVLNLADKNGEPVTSPSMAVWVDNWVRLGLMDLDFATHLTAPGAYDWVKKHPDYRKCSALSGVDPAKLDINEGVLRRRDFGTRFKETVLSDPQSVPGA